MGKKYDTIIIGSGPAGLAAAIYAERAKLECLIIEKNYVSGGQVINTYEVDNYPGLPGINGFDMATKFREHADALGAEFVTAEVSDIIIEGTDRKIVTDQGEFVGKTVILAAGARHRKLNVPGEEELAGMGVSYCATCDGAFFKNKTVAVVGGGDVAVEDAIFLARVCEKVYLIHRRDELRAAKILQEKLFVCDNVEVIWDSVVEGINGEDHVESVAVKNVNTEKEDKIVVDGVFIAVGILPNSEVFQSIVETDKNGYIVANEDCVTNKKGIFAAGDIRTKMLRQIITAAADGANAVTSVQNYLIYA